MWKLYYDDEQAECTDCHEILPHSEFYPRTSPGTGKRNVHYHCRACEQKIRDAKSSPYPYSDQWMKRVENGTFTRTLYFDSEVAQCRDCKRILPHSEFYKAKKRGKRARSVQYNCIDCERERWYQRTYGISRQVYLDLHEQQNGLCAICGECGDLVLDHSHDTGDIRGLLCRPCNKALHWLERPEWMEAAQAYLRKECRLKAVK